MFHLINNKIVNNSICEYEILLSNKFSFISQLFAQFM